MKKTKGKTYKSRMILAPQSAGRIGKSSVAEAIMEWSIYAGIDSAILDLDSQHKTISRRYPEEANVFPEAAQSDDGWRSLMLALNPPPSPMLIVDVPAQITDHLLIQLVDRDGLDQLDKLGIRLTCLIFSAEDTAARESAASVVQELGDRADWVVVHQPGPTPLIKDWGSTKLGKRLAELGAGELNLPRITRPTLEAYVQAVKTEKKWMTFHQAGKLDPCGMGMEFDLWRNRALVGCEDIAELLLPDTKLIKTKVFRGGELPVVGSRKTKKNEFEF